jgi:hypothetical protein
MPAETGETVEVLVFGYQLAAGSMANATNGR